MHLDYEHYRDAIYGGWIGKSIGGAIGDRFEAQKRWIELDPADFFPAELPPNDDLDLQVVWLGVLEERGLATTADDLAAAWLERCWYPMSEYGVFRRNWRCGIHPPTSGSFDNVFWGDSMGCPIRAEIWGYVFPGDPERAAHYAGYDGSLDHGPESVGAEQMYAAMAAEAFFVDDLRLLVERHRRYLPAGSAIERQVGRALDGVDRGEDPRAVRERLIHNAPAAEACSATINVPLTLLGLFAGGGDPVETIRTTLAFGYDTDCTLATALSFLGQVGGSASWPASLRDPIGDELVMGIAYRREEMTLSALARDTARVGCLLAAETGACRIAGAPEMAALPATAVADWRLTVEHLDPPAAAPGEMRRVRVRAEGIDRARELQVEAPAGWSVTPATVVLSPQAPAVELHCHCAREIPVLPIANRFTAGCGGRELVFGCKGAELWRLLGIELATEPLGTDPAHGYFRTVADTYADPSVVPIAPEADSDEHFRRWSAVLGRPALVTRHQGPLRARDLSPIPSAWTAVLEREVHSPDARRVELQIGHDCPLRVWCNGEALGEEPGPVQWQPLTSCWTTELRPGPNRIRVQLTKQASDLRFSLEIKDLRGPRDWDFAYELADANPLVAAPVPAAREALAVG